jgi:hypothetical protein
MEKQSQCRWRKVCTRKTTGQSPVPRWGHTCCVIPDEIVFFGGYAGTIVPSHRLELHERYMELQRHNNGVERDQDQW